MRTGLFRWSSVVPDARYYRQQAERYARVAEQCSIADLVPYYRKLAFDCLVQAVRAEAAAAEPAEKAPRRRKRAAAG
jgi:hypothetical protein